MASFAADYINGDARELHEARAKVRQQLKAMFAAWQSAAKGDAKAKRFR